MKHRWAFIFPLFLILCGLIQSCKEENRTYPAVSIESPQKGSQFSYGDTITVKAIIEDSDGKVTYDILEGDRDTHFQGRLHSHYGNEYVFQFFFTDKYLESGAYDIKISAYNGENITSDFISIYLNELPKRYRGVSILSANPGGSGMTLTRLDSIGGVMAIQLQGDHSFMANSSRYGQILTAPVAQGELTGFTFTDLVQEFTFSLMVSKPDKYRNLYVFNRNSYLFVSDGRIISLGEKGGVSLNFSLAEPFIALNGDYNNNELVIAAQEENLNKYWLLVVNPESGYIRKQAFVAAKPHRISYSGNNTCFLIYYRSGQTVVAEYSPVTNVITERYFLPGEKPRDLLMTGSLGYIATDRAIYSFTPSLSQLQEQFSFGASALAFDAVNNEMYMAAGNMLYKFPVGTLQNQYVFLAGDSIKDIEVMYNK